MKIEMFIKNSKTDFEYNVSDIISGVTIFSQLSGRAGSISFNMLKNVSGININCGAYIKLLIDGKGRFYGRIEQIASSEKDLLSIKAYDGLVFFKNNDIFVFSDKTCDEIFTTLCAAVKLPCKVVSKSDYKLEPKIYDNKSMFEMLNDSIDLTLANSGKWFVVRDNFGTLEHTELSALRSDIVIGENSLLTNYNITESISKSYNTVKLTQENELLNTRTTVVEKDNETIKEWGIRQYFESVSALLNKAQIEKEAQGLLEIYNVKTKNVTLNCLGNLDVFAGCSVYINLEEQNLKQFAVVETCEHSLKNDMHNMKLRLLI